MGSNGGYNFRGKAYELRKERIRYLHSGGSAEQVF